MAWTQKVKFEARGIALGFLSHLKNSFLHCATFLYRGDFSSETVAYFASKINVEAGIVVGRLQKDKYIAYNSSVNKIKNKYRLS